MKIDRDIMRKALQYKKDNNSLPPQNPENQSGDKNNSTEVNKDIPGKVVKVVENSNTTTFPYYREKLNTTTFTTSNANTPNTSVENSSSTTQENEEEGITIEDNKIVIKAKKGYKFEINYGFVGIIEDMTRMRDLKIPQLPQYELVAKKGNEALSIIVTIDFYEMEGKTVYTIRNMSDVVDKLYKFRAEKHISRKLIIDAINSWLLHIEPEKRIQWKDAMEVVKEFKEWDEINEDPLQFFMDRSTEVIGNEKLKIAVLLSVVSSQLEELYGIYRVHLVLTGSSGAGKSSTIKSILKLFYNDTDGVEDYIVLTVTRMTKEALGRLDVDTLDGKVFFIEQLDNIEGIDYLREAMSEGYIKTLTTVKDAEGNLVSKTVIIPGQPAFISTNVTANIDHQILNRSLQLYLSPAEDEKLKRKIIEAILSRRKQSKEEIDKLKLVTYVWLKSRPKDPEITKDLQDQLVNILSKFINFRNIYRATEVTRNLIRSTASLFGHEKALKDDMEFVMKYFKKDIILTTLELSERDLQLLTWFRDHGFVQAEKDEETRDISTSEIAQVVKMSTQETKRILDSLYDKGLLWKAYDGKKFTWALSHYGVRVLAELEKEVEEEQEEEDALIDDQLLAIISSKLMGKDIVKEEELRSIIERVAQAKDIAVQDLFIKVLEKRGIIKNNGDGTWKTQ